MIIRKLVNKCPHYSTSTKTRRFHRNLWSQKKYIKGKRSPIKVSLAREKNMPFYFISNLFKYLYEGRRSALPIPMYSVDGAISSQIETSYLFSMLFLLLLFDARINANNTINSDITCEKCEGGIIFKQIKGICESCQHSDVKCNMLIFFLAFRLFISLPRDGLGFVWLKWNYGFVFQGIMDVVTTDHPRKLFLQNIPILQLVALRILSLHVVFLIHNLKTSKRCFYRITK